MCSPEAFQAAATAVGSYGAYQQSRTEEAYARHNQRAMQIAARDAAARGQTEEIRFRQELSQLKGKQRASIGASGALLDTGSSVDLTADTAGFGELDALNVRANAAREVFAYQTQATSYGLEGKQARLRGNYALAGGLLSTASQLSASQQSLLGSKSKKK